MSHNKEHLIVYYIHNKNVMLSCYQQLNCFTVRNIYTAKLKNHTHTLIDLIIAGLNSVQK